MKKSCKLICLILVLATVLSMFAGCERMRSRKNTTASNHKESSSVSDDAGYTNPSVTDPLGEKNPKPGEDDTTESDDPDVDITEPEDPDVEPTEPTGPVDPDITEPTEPEDITEPEPTEPENPVEPTEPDVEQDVTEPTAPTNPTTPTTPSTPSAPTEPTTPTEPVKPHTCSFTIKGKTVAATCEEKGYTMYSCSCGKSQKKDYTNAKGHDYVQTDESYGSHVYDIIQVLFYECNICGNRHMEEHVMTAEEQAAYYKAAGEALVKYINQFRLEQGDTAATILPGLTLVAEYRAVQLKTNFAHDTADTREAFAYYQYGEWHDMTQHGFDESYSYWSANGKEAIAAGAAWSDPDNLGKQFAEMFMHSKNHWNYVGDSKWTYIGVGISYGVEGLSACVLQTKVNYG